MSNISRSPSHSLIVDKFIEKYGYNFSWNLETKSWLVIVDIKEDTKKHKTLGVEECQIDLVILRVIKESKSLTSAP